MMRTDHSSTSENKPNLRPAAIPSAGLAIQTKLVIGAANDPLEAEADAMADRVMRMPDTPRVQRKCAECEEDDERMQRKPLASEITPFIQAKSSENSASASDAVANHIESTRGGGNPLPETTRSFMESRFGTDFSGVRVHSDHATAQLSRDLNAQAFTVGRDIYFDDGKFAPGTKDGRRLIAHELTHAMQQSSSDGMRAPHLLQRDALKKTDFPITKYEYTGKEQKATGRTDAIDGYVDLEYDPKAGVFTCKFQIRWRYFPENWKNKAREEYKEEFKKLIKEQWENKYSLIEYSGAAPKSKTTGRRAKVIIDFEDVVQPEFSSDKEEVEWHMKNPGAVRKHFFIDVSDKDIRESVRGGSLISLDPKSLTKGKNPVKPSRERVEPEVYTEEYLEDPYYKSNIEIDVPKKIQSYWQIAAVHEFGHIIGLADEYVLSKEDFEKLKQSRGEAFALEQLHRRRVVGGGVMNIGSALRPDYYRPFAEWLSSLTKQTWRVKGDFGQQGSD